ncbi:MAG: hypothetical protein AB2L18_01295 [Anaerolineaceae bacterium]
MEKEKLLPWLLEEENPSVRAFTLHDILGVEEDDDQLKEARSRIMTQEPVSTILSLQSPEGWWGNADSMIMPMYTSTAWQVMLLAELGATVQDKRITKAVYLICSNTQAEDGSFPRLEGRFVKHQPMDLFCNDALISYGLAGVGVSPQDERMHRALEFLANTLLSGEYGCRFNEDGGPCAWGVVKGLRVFSVIKEAERTESMQRAIQTGAEYLLEQVLVKMDFFLKEGNPFSEHWFRFGFPRSYQADVLQMAFILAKLGYGKDSRLQPVIDFIASKQLPAGGWMLEETWNQLIVPFTKPSKIKPNQWVTWQAYFVLVQSGRIQ